MDKKNEIKLTANITDEEYAWCHGIIHSASAAAAAIGGGLAQIPVADTVAITGLQIGMIVGLGQALGVEITRSGAEALLASEMSGFVGKTVAKVLCGWIPGVGNIINAATGASITEAIGWLVVEDFGLQRSRDERRG